MEIRKYFHYKDHGILTPCTGVEPYPYEILRIKGEDVISTKYAVGHGRKKAITFFRFTKVAPQGGYLLSSGKIISEEEYNEAKNSGTRLCKS